MARSRFIQSRILDSSAGLGRCSDIGVPTFSWIGYGLEIIRLKFSIGLAVDQPVET
jgi:hypothetical protein